MESQELFFLTPYVILVVVLALAIVLNLTKKR